MTTVMKRLTKGVVLKGEATDVTENLEGSLWQNSATARMKTYIEAAVREVVTNSQTQTLTNKTIDADLNTITNIENADIKAGAAIDASKLADGSVSSTEFQYINSLTSNAQTQLTANASAASTAQTTINDHIADASDAHDASAISNIPSGNLAATDQQAVNNELQSDIDTRATSSALGAHTGASTGVHGVTGAVVGTTDTQTLTNKTLTAPAISSPTGLVKGDVGLGNVDNTSDATKNAATATLTNKTITGADIRTPVRSDVKQDTKANLTTYALTASNGQLCFATDTKEMFQVVDTLLESVGGGAGIGGVDILFSQTFEEAALTDFTQTGLSLSTSSPLHGAISALMTHQAATSQSFKQVIAVDEKFRGQAMLLELNIKSTATAGNVTLNVYDETNAANIVASEQLTLSSATGGIKVFSAFTIPATCLSMSYTITALQESGSPVTRIDDILCQLSSASLLETSVTVPNITAWQAYTPTFTGFGTATNIEFEWRQVGENAEIRGKFTSGTATAVEARMSLPNGYTSAGTGLIPSIQQVGAGSASAAASNQTTILIEPSVTYLTFGQQGSTAGLAKVNGDAFMANGRLCSFFASVPCAGLTATSDVTIPLTQSGIVQEADSMIRVDTVNGYGSTNTCIRRFSNITQSIGSDVSYVDSATLGASFTILNSGTYSISYVDVMSGAANMGISKNSTQLTSGITTITTADRLAVVTVSSANFTSEASWTGYLVAGDVIRPHADTTTSGTPTAKGTFVVTKQGSLKQVNINTNSKITIPTSELRFEGASARGAVATAIVKFDTMAKIRGDAFTVTNTANDGTYVTMTKKGRLSISSSTLLTSANGVIEITKNQSTLTSAPGNSETLARGQAYAATAAVPLSVFSDVSIGDIIRVASSSAITASGSNQFNLSFQEQDIQVSVSNTLPQFSESDSSVRLDTANGYGSSGTKIRRFSNVRDNIGVDVLYADSATAGASFTAMSSGIYEISYNDNFSGASDFGLSKNASSLTTNFSTLAASERVAYGSTAASSFNDCAAVSIYLVAGDIIRPHSNGSVSGVAAQSIFTMSKVGKPNVTGVDVTPFVQMPFEKAAVGEIKAFAGNIDGAYYLSCDGAAVNRGTYAQLFAAIGITHGQGDGSTTFNLPDYRGRFLRGTANGSTNDPDRASRTAMNTGGNTGDNVGSIQADINLAHTHTFPVFNVHSGSNVQAGTGQSSNLGNEETSSSGGSESRPKNAYVNYGIRFKTATDSILTVPETFSTDTAALTYAGSGTYTLATLNTAPVGTFITYTVAASSNTRTQTTTAPTQTTSDMNTNGIRIFTRAYGNLSTAGNPVVAAIQIGKGLKGIALQAYLSAAKVNAASLDSNVKSITVEYGLSSKDYNELTGILLLDGGFCFNTTTTNREIQGTDGTSASAGYIVINASKNPALTGLNVNSVYMRAAGNAGEVITANVTNVPFIEIADSNGAFNGSQFTVPSTGSYTITGNIVCTTATAGTRVRLYVDAVSSRLISTAGDSSISTHAFRITDRYTVGQVLSIRLGDTKTLSNNATDHWLTITKVGG